MQHRDEETVVLTGEGEVAQDKEYEPLYKKSRSNFVRKVYGILCAQLLLTSAFVIVAVTNEKVNLFLRTTYWLTIVCAVVAISTLYALACYRSLANSVPINFIILGIFTLAESYLV